MSSRACFIFSVFLLFVCLFCFVLFCLFWFFFFGGGEGGGEGVGSSYACTWLCMRTYACVYTQFEMDPDVFETVFALYDYSIKGECLNCLSYCFVVEGAPQSLRLAWINFGLCLLAPV